MSVQQGREFVTSYVITLMEATCVHVKEDMSYQMMAYTAKVTVTVVHVYKNNLIAALTKPMKSSYATLHTYCTPT